MHPDENERFLFGSVHNPFSDELNFEIKTDRTQFVNLELLDANGKKIREKKILLEAGSHWLLFENTGELAPGMYILKARNNEEVIFRRLLKK
ncbi:MAG: T9SS type A sorting domain-containing protein [Chitinophagaceae bacterium]|nr:T9SS type A sorting domain-containing protein [Chitinophagaceae bacterium]